MSVNRAQRLLRGLRFHHLGFCFFWAVSFVVLSGLQGSPDYSDIGHLYILVEQLVTLGAVVVCSLLFWKRSAVLPHSLALVAGFALSGGALLYFLTFHLGYGDAFMAVAAGVLIGCANGLFFLLWQTFFVTEGQQRAIIYIPLSAVLSILLYSLVLLLPSVALIFASVVALPFLAMFTLNRSLAEIEMYPITPLDHKALGRVVGDLWKPVFCVCSIGFVWKLVSQISAPPAASGDPSAVMVLVGFGAAGLLVAVFELFSSRGFEILRIYQILFPIITGIFLLPTFFGSSYNPFLTGILMFGFETVNLLLLVTCAVYAAQKMYSPIALYGLCVAPTLAFMTAGDVLGSVLTPIFAYDFAYVVNVLFVCIYLLSVVLVMVSRGKRPKTLAVPAEDELVLDDDSSVRTLRTPDCCGRPTKASSAVGDGPAAAAPVSEPGSPGGSGDAASVVDPAPFSFFRERGLSPREIEVACLLMRGHSIAAIARKLFISENTTRGHTKSIYKKLDVHARQELIDMAEGGFC